MFVVTTYPGCNDRIQLNVGYWKATVQPLPVKAAPNWFGDRLLDLSRTDGRRKGKKIDPAVEPASVPDQPEGRWTCIMTLAAKTLLR